MPLFLLEKGKLMRTVQRNIVTAHLLAAVAAIGNTFSFPGIHRAIHFAPDSRPESKSFLGYHTSPAVFYRGKCGKPRRTNRLKFAKQAKMRRRKAA
jgi:hypothetical protein